VEYRQPGIQQVQVKSEIGFDFSRCLRSILRQDPDIIMVGEIRDPETGADRGAGRAHGAPRAVDAAHQRRDLDAGAAHQYRRGPFPGGDRGERRRGPAAGQAHLPVTARRNIGPSPEEIAAFAPGPAPDLLYRGARGAGSAAISAMRGAWRSTRCSAINAPVRAHGDRGPSTRDTIRRSAADAGMMTLRTAGFRRVAQGGHDARRSHGRGRRPGLRAMPVFEYEVGRPAGRAEPGGAPRRKARGALILRFREQGRIVVGNAHGGAGGPRGGARGSRPRAPNVAPPGPRAG